MYFFLWYCQYALLASGDHLWYMYARDYHMPSFVSARSLAVCAQGVFKLVPPHRRLSQRGSIKVTMLCLARHQVHDKQGNPTVKSSTSYEKAFCAGFWSQDHCVATTGAAAWSERQSGAAPGHQGPGPAGHEAHPEPAQRLSAVPTPFHHPSELLKTFTGHCRQSAPVTTAGNI